MFARVNDGGGVQPVTSGPITNQVSARTRYARSGDAYIAYRVFGDGPRDIILVPGTISHADLYWEMPANDYLLKRLSAFARVIVFDKRGQGLSDRVAEQTMEERLGDVCAVMDAAGSERAAIYGWSEGGQLALMFAASHPERTSGLVLYGAYASLQSEPWNVSPERFSCFLSELTSHWGEGVLVKINAPSRVNDDAFVESFGKLERAVASPGSILALMRANYEFDASRVLTSIHAPALVLHRQGDALVPVRAGRHLALRIPGARYYELPGDDHMLQAFDLDVLDLLIDRVEEFVTALPLCRRPYDDRHRRQFLESASLDRDVQNGWYDGAIDRGARMREIESPVAYQSQPAVFRREGEYWTVAWQGSPVRLLDVKGLHYIAYLIANAGREVSAIELAAMGKSQRADRRAINTVSVRGLGDADAILDAKALARYRCRVSELKEELANAEMLNDSGQVTRLRLELESLSDQIAAAVGLRGNCRASASHRERARLMVTKAIKAVIAKVRASNAALGHHLATCIKTGNLCMYDPGPHGPAWRL